MAFNPLYEPDYPLSFCEHVAKFENENAWRFACFNVQDVHREIYGNLHMPSRYTEGTSINGKTCTKC